MAREELPEYVVKTIYVSKLAVEFDIEIQRQ